MSQPQEKKRGRKKKNPDATTSTEEVQPIEKPAPKKRGRKPKGGKIIQNILQTDNNINNDPNVILHLKCNLSDINENDTNYKYNPDIEAIQSFNFENNSINNFIIEQAETNKFEVDDNESVDSTDNNDVKNVWKKLNSLKLNLHKNNISDKRSSCFWCTYDFDNPPIFIPKNEIKDAYQVYGCFCSPECSVAYLMNEKIDSSSKFERYQLINHVYGKIYNYDKNIKPAPNPYYLLDKYYGNLSIKEYRDLFKNEQLLNIVEKPLTHVFPELYEDNSDFLLNKRTIPNNSTYKLKRKSTLEKKTSILENMGIKTVGE